MGKYKIETTRTGSNEIKTFKSEMTREEITKYFERLMPLDLVEDLLGRVDFYGSYPINGFSDKAQVMIITKEGK